MSRPRQLSRSGLLHGLASLGTLTRGLIPLAGVALVACGCSLFEASKDATEQTMSMLKPNPEDYRDGTTDEGDEWIEQAGQEARGSRPIEKDPDQWWGRLFMSNKARSIERNMGIGWDE